MADYALRYYKEFGVQDSIVQLQIYKYYKAPEFAPAPIEIGGVLQEMHLVMQGDQGEVTDPIVKTSLELSLVDAPNTEYGRKTGDWEEFYTSSSTEYLVKVLVNNVVEWSGYITPDSFEEDLTLHGTVSIIARDNIGHLQDFTFDEIGNSDGMISVRDIFTKAWKKIESKMTLSIPTSGDVIWPECYGYRPYEIMLNVEAFADKTWYEVVESVLDSFGLVLRYVGGNKCCIYPLRSMPLLSYSDFNKVPINEAAFQAFAHRSLQPTYKKIIDVIRYESGDIYKLNMKDEDYIESSFDIDFKEYDDKGNETIVTKTVPSWAFASASVWKKAGNIGVINPYAVESGGRYGSSLPNQDTLLVSVFPEIKTANNVYLSRNLMSAELMVDVSFNFYGLFYKAQPGSSSISSPRAKTQNLTIHYTVECFTSDKHYWFDIESDQFVEESKTLTASAGFGYADGQRGQQLGEVKHSLYIPEGATRMVVRIYGFTASVVEDGALRPGGTPVFDEIQNGKLYGRIANILIAQANASDFQDSTVVSLYDDTANVLINRSPALGPGPIVLSAKVIKNGMYLPETAYPPANPWNWPDDDFQTNLRVLIAQQHLLYNSRPNNLITGTLVHEKKLLKMPSLWSYKDKNHILISGRLNYLNGYLEDVKLREYARWPELYPDDFYLQTEAGDNVLTEDDKNVLIAAQEYRFLMENGDQVKTEDDNYIKLS